MDVAGRVPRVRETDGFAALDALLVTRLPNIRYLCGFTGSAGMLLVARDTVTFVSDGRYEEQSRHEVPDIRREIYGVSSRTIGEAAGMFGTVESIVSGLKAFPGSPFVPLLSAKGKAVEPAPSTYVSRISM